MITIPRLEIYSGGKFFDCSWAGIYRKVAIVINLPRPALGRAFGKKPHFCCGSSRRYKLRLCITIKHSEPIHGRDQPRNTPALLWPLNSERMEDFIGSNANPALEISVELRVAGMVPKHMISDRSAVCVKFDSEPDLIAVRRSIIV